jgi:hypothetical protein
LTKNLRFHFKAANVGSLAPLGSLAHAFSLPKHFISPAAHPFHFTDR